MPKVTIRAIAGWEKNNLEIGTLGLDCGAGSHQQFTGHSALEFAIGVLLQHVNRARRRGRNWNQYIGTITMRFASIFMPRRLLSIGLIAIAPEILLVGSWAQSPPTQVLREPQIAAPVDESKLVCNIPLLLGTPGTRTLSPERPPSHINVMATRYWDYIHTVAGYTQTHVPLIAVEGQALGPSGGLDDPGSFYFIPRIAQLLKLTVAQAIDVFYGSALVLATLLSALGFLLLFHARLVRTLVLFGLIVISALAYKVGDVYLFSFVAVAVVVPWSLLLIRSPRNTGFLAAAVLALGLVIGLANIVRGHAGTAALIFLLGLLLFQLRAPTQKKLVLALCLAVGFFAPKLFLGRTIARRDSYLTARCAGYTSISAQHVFWHSIYIGLGYLQNDFGIRWNDAVSYDRVQSIAPGTPFGSREYERILQTEVLSFARQHPEFVLTTLISKVGVLLCVFLIFGNIGLLAALKYPKPWAIEVSFWAALAFNSLFGVLVIPKPAYLLGFVSLAAFYGMASVGWAWESRSATSQGYQRIQLPGYESKAPVAVA